MARFELEQARQRQAGAMHRRRTEAKIAQMRLEREAARMEYIEQQIAACHVHAPHDGVMQHEWRPLTREPMGERFAPGVLIHTRQPLVRVESMERPKLILRVAAERAEQVSSGQAATIRFHAFSQQTFEGHVTEVRLAPSVAGGAPEGVIVVAVRCNDALDAHTARRQFDANVLCLAGELLNDTVLRGIVEVWLSTDFEPRERSQRRIRKIEAMEEGDDPSEMSHDA